MIQGARTSLCTPVMNGNILFSLGPTTSKPFGKTGKASLGKKRIETYREGAREVMEEGKVIRRPLNRKLEDYKNIRASYDEGIVVDQYSSASENSPESWTGEECSSETEDDDDESD